MKILALSNSPFFPSPFKKYYLDKITRLMNNTNMKQTLFSTAILLAVAELRQAGKFSAYDVTRKLRDQVNKGELTFTDRTTEDLDGVQTYRIEHDDVKDIFNDLWSNDAITNLSRKHNGNYWEFSDAAALKPSFVGGIGPVTRLTLTPVTVCGANGNPLTTQVVTSRATVTSKDPLTSQVIDYLRGRAGTPTSMKQIQSRFKGVTKTCEEYAKLLIGAGYIISNSNLPISQQTV